MAIIISYPISASRIIVKYYVHMGEGAGRTLRQVAHVTQDKVSHIISEVGRRNREFVPILFVKTTDFQLVFVILSMV